MALSIKSDEADRLARELAAETGETLTEAVVVALKERLDREHAGTRPAWEPAGAWRPRSQRCRSPTPGRQRRSSVTTTLACPVDGAGAEEPCRRHVGSRGGRPRRAGEPRACAPPGGGSRAADARRRPCRAGHRHRGRLWPAGQDVVERFLRDARIDIVPVDADLANRAMSGWRRYGKGRHRAGLNFGDCFTYALAERTGHAVLCTGRRLRRDGYRRAAT